MGSFEFLKADWRGLERWLRPGPRRRRWYGWMAGLLFLGVAVASAWGLPPVDVQWPWLGAAALLVLVSTAVLAAEYRTAAWLLGSETGGWESLRVTIYSSAANLLPIPGSLAVRTEALRRKGSGLGAALGANVAMGLGWLGVALLLAGALLSRGGSRGVAAAFAGFGVAVVASMGIAVARRATGPPALRAGLVILLVEAVYVSVSALRIYAVLAGLGLGVTLAQATALAVASALAAGVGFFPGGLGLRELFSGGLGVLVGLAPAVGAFAGVVDRIVALLVRSLLAGVVLGIGVGAEPEPEGLEEEMDRR